MIQTLGIVTIVMIQGQRRPSILSSGLGLSADGDSTPSRVFRLTNSRKTRYATTAMIS